MSHAFPKLNKVPYCKGSKANKNALSMQIAVETYNSEQRCI